MEIELHRRRQLGIIKEVRAWIVAVFSLISLVSYAFQVVDAAFSAPKGLKREVLPCVEMPVANAAPIKKHMGRGQNP